MQLEPTSKELTDLFDYIFGLVAHGDFHTLNHDIETIVAKYTATIWLVGYLRITFRHRKLLPAWPHLFEETKKELTARGHDVEALLRGLE